MLNASSGLTLPVLAGIAQEIDVRERSALTEELVVALLHAGLTQPHGWRGDVHEFLLSWFEQLVDSRGGAVIREHLFPVYAVLCDGPARWGYYAYGETPADPEAAYIAIGAGGDQCCALVMTDTLRVLEEADPRFPATFFGWFVGGIHAVVNTYSWDDAQEYEYRLAEWGEDDEGSPITERNLVPEVLRRRRLSDRVALERLELVGGAAADIMRGAYEVHRAGAKVKAPRVTEFGDEWAFRPLPALLMCSDAHDQVSGHFDAEMDDLYNSGEAAPPSLVFKLDPANPRELRASIDSFLRACDTLNAASRLISILPNATPPRPLTEVLGGIADDGYALNFLHEDDE